MGDRNACVRRRSNPGRHSWNDFEPQSFGLKCLSFFTSASEDEWIAALEAHDPLSFASEANEQTVNIVLRRRVATAAALSHVVQLDGSLTAPNARQREQRGIRERVVDNGVGGYEQLAAAQRQKPRITGPGTDEVDDT
jgi:hypothetical protein